MAKQEQQSSLGSQMNEFIKGFITDLDPTKMPPDAWTDPTQNVRVMNKKGKGYVITNIEGNEEAFQVDGTILGWCQYKGILYIASTYANGDGEIGCFPSCDWSVDNGIFQRVYRPLYNYDPHATGTPQELTTSLLGFTLVNNISMFPRESYDGSVDLMICDDHRPNIIVNTGFDINGYLTERVITDNSFTTWINQISMINDSARIDTAFVVEGGQLKYGNYICYLRYVTQDLSPTHFFASSFPLQVYNGAPAQLSSVQGGQGGNMSSKMIQLLLDDVDTVYTYIEVALVRFYSDNNMPYTYDIVLVDKKYPILSDNFTIDITGTEGTQSITLEEILADRLNEDTSKDHTTVENMYIQCHTSGKALHHNDLAEFAGLIAPAYDDTLQVAGNPLDPLSTLGAEGQYKDYVLTYGCVGYFRGEIYSYAIVYEFNSGNTSLAYPCIGMDDFLNTQVDKEHYTKPGDVSGVYRFPNTTTSPFSTGAMDLNILGITFDVTTDAAAFAASSDFIRNNVKGFYFVRTDRKNLLKAEGLMMHCSVPEIPDTTVDDQYTFTARTDEVVDTVSWRMNGLVNDAWGTTPIEQNYIANKYHQCPSGVILYKDFWGALVNYGTPLATTTQYINRYFPIWRGYMPMRGVTGVSTYNYVSRFFAKANKYAFYSPDMMIQLNTELDGFTHIEHVAHTLTLADDHWTKWNHYNDVVVVGQTALQSWMYPRMSLTEVTQLTFTLDANAPQSCEQFKATIIGEEAVYKPSGASEFINYTGGGDLSFDDPDNLYQASTSIAAYITTRTSMSPKYIALDLEGSDTEDDYSVSSAACFGMRIVDIWSIDPNSIAFTYAKMVAMFGGNELYTKISGLILPTVNGGTNYSAYDNTKVYYQGDCFLQRVYFKQRYYYGTAEDEGARATGALADGGGNIGFYNYNSHGLIVGVVLQNKYNHAMRFPSPEGNDYYPHITNPETWVKKIFSDTGSESFLANTGYSVTRSIKQYLKFDPLAIYKEEHYPVRIRYSEEAYPGEIKNSFKIMRYGNYKDYDAPYGDMMGVLNINNWLISVQHDSINRHFVNEKNINQTGEAGPLIIGTGETLPKQYLRLASFGSQHTFGIYKGDNGYGVDVKKRLIWQVGSATSDTRGLYPVARNISKEKGIEKWVYDYFDQFAWRSDRMISYPDNPSYQGGITIGFNPKFKEIDFTFKGNIILQCSVDIEDYYSLVIVNETGIPILHRNNYQVYYIYDDEYVFHTATPDTIEEIDGVLYITWKDATNNQPIRFPLRGMIVWIILDYVAFNKTLCFSQDSDYFLGERTYTPKIYMNLYNDYYSYINTPGHSVEVYIHNVPTASNFGYFYGALAAWKVSSIVFDNPMVKKFANIIVDCPMHDTNNLAQLYYLFEGIEYETQLQTSQHYPVREITDSAPHREWIDPRYKEGKMHCPIQAEITRSGEFAYMRGVWLKETFTFRMATETYIKNIITMYNLSFS